MPLVRNDLSKVLCLPLAPAGLLICAHYLLKTAAEIYYIVTRPHWKDGLNYTSIILNSLPGLFALFGILGILLRSPSLVGFGGKLGFPLLTSLVSHLVLQWIKWGRPLVQKGRSDPMSGEELTGRWRPNRHETTIMALLTSGSFIAIFLCFYLMSVFSSLSAIFRVGGSGWRYMDKDEVRDYVKRGKRKAPRSAV